MALAISEGLLFSCNNSEALMPDNMSLLISLVYENNSTTDGAVFSLVEPGPESKKGISQQSTIRMDIAGKIVLEDALNDPARPVDTQTGILTTADKHSFLNR